MSLLLTDDTAPETEDGAPPSEAPEPEAEEAASDAEATQDEASDDDTDQDEAPPEPQLYTVRVDGGERQVTLEELTRSYSGQAYIQKGMQEAAARRKEAEAAFAALQGEMQRVQALRQQFESKGLLPRPTPPDPSLAESDPVGYVKATAAFQAKAQAWQAQQAQLRQVEEQQARAMSAAQDAYLRQQAAALAERIPDFAKPETAAKQRKRLTQAAESYGYTAAEIDALTDARAVQVLHDAAMWREYQAAKAQAQAPRQPEAPKHIPNKPRRPEPPQLARARKIEQARKSKSVDSWAALLLE